MDVLLVELGKLSMKGLEFLKQSIGAQVFPYKFLVKCELFLRCIRRARLCHHRGERRRGSGMSVSRDLVWRLDASRHGGGSMFWWTFKRRLNY